MHKRIKIKKGNDHLRIMVGWRTDYFSALILTILGVGFCLIFGATATNSITWSPDDKETSVAAFLVNSVLLVFAAYGITAYWINFSVVNVSKEKILIHSEPIPFPYPRRRTLRTPDVVQLFVEEVAFGSGEAGLSCRNELSALLQSGEKITLLVFNADSEAKETARLIEQEVEQYLGIDDEHVEGEAVSH